MGTAEHHIDHEHDGGDAERPPRGDAQHDLEHDDAGDQLPSQIKEQQQGEEGHHDPHPVRLIAAAKVLRDGAVAEPMAAVAD